MLTFYFLISNTKHFIVRYYVLCRFSASNLNGIGNEKLMNLKYFYSFRILNFYILLTRNWSKSIKSSSKTIFCLNNFKKLLSYSSITGKLSEFSKNASNKMNHPQLFHSGAFLKIIVICTVGVSYKTLFTEI